MDDRARHRLSGAAQGTKQPGVTVVIPSAHWSSDAVHASFVATVQAGSAATQPK
jgi:hypothetical protein